ncbi:MAG: hypothetical protein JO200_01935 [Comamonas sp.]|nr:hypothetical protein [Comamonas sp.]
MPYIVHEQLGYAISQVGWFAAVTIVGASLGTMITRRLGASLRPQLFLYAGAGLSCCMALLLLLVQGLGGLNGALLVAITFTMTMGAGMASPAALSRALSAAPGLRARPRGCMASARWPWAPSAPSLWVWARTRPWPAQSRR